MGMGGQRIAQEEDGVNAAEGDLTADLLIAAEGSGQIAVHRQAAALLNEGSRRAGGHELVPAERVPVSQDKFDEIILFAVVSDKRNAHGMASLQLECAGTRLVVAAPCVLAPSSTSDGR